MTTPESQGEPFAEAAGEAVQTAVMSVRLVMAIADAVRRHQQKQRKGAVGGLPPADKASVDAKEELKDLLPADFSAALLTGADWPQLAQQLMALKNAGVDLEQLLPRVGEIGVTVRDAVAANEAGVAREGTGQWEKMLRETLPAGPVREAILSSPTWPDIAATMAQLKERGVDVQQILASAHDEGLGVDQAIAKVLGAREVPTTSLDAMLSYGPMTKDLDIPTYIDLADRELAFLQLSIGAQENERFVRMVKAAMPGREREVDLMVAHKQWPLLVARMAEMERQEKLVEKHLAGLMKDTSWERGKGTVGSRLVQATSNVLRHAPGEAPPLDRPKVSAAAARSQSSTLGPTKAQASKGAAPAQAGVAAHRETGPVAKQGKTR
ncbi:hypothetical protein ACF05T_28195 [Streptomyces lateritius]|uniref:Aromatic ring-opening dioxygenase LigA n=1 Tax=Streptomyces lateritius TaxID=67313 RepID=A0ABW6YJ97_9ACTN